MTECYLRKQTMRDVLFLNKIYEVTNNEEIKSISDIIDMENIDFNQRQTVELFLLKLKNQIGSWYDMLVGMMEHFDYDIVSIL